jgi:hypothetical protein
MGPCHQYEVQEVVHVWCGQEKGELGVRGEFESGVKMCPSDDTPSCWWLKMGDLHRCGCGSLGGPFAPGIMCVCCYVLCEKRTIQSLAHDDGGDWVIVPLPVLL